MRMQSETRSIGKIIRQPVLRSEPAGSERRSSRCDLGDEIAALDDHRVFRKAR